MLPYALASGNTIPKPMGRPPPLPADRLDALWRISWS